jgi:putative sigma-54 modulation protein
MAHQVKVFGKNMEVTNRIRDYVTKKAEKLYRLLRETEEVRVDLAYVKSARSAADRQVAQITLRGKKALLRAEERADDIFAAFDASLDKMQRQIERYKGKHYRGRGDGRSASDFVEAPLEDETEEEIIVRRKRFPLYPMNEAEAVEQMNLLGHDQFFIFYNADTDSVNVLYRRRDGSYGLIEPYVA